MIVQICAGCRYFDGPTEDIGICRRYAPRALVTWTDRPSDDDEVSDANYQRFPVWPSVTPTDWCGEWAASRPKFGVPANA